MTFDDIADERRRAVEAHLDEFRYLDSRVGDAVFDLKYGTVDPPKNILRDLEELDRVMTRVRYWLEDQLIDVGK